MPQQFRFNWILTKSNFRPSETGTAAVYIEFNQDIRQHQQKQIHMVGTECGKHH